MSLRDRINAQRSAIANNKAQFARSYRFKVGKTIIRVLPGVSVPDDFYKPYGAHYIKDPRDGDTILAVVGDAETCYGKVDPVREAIGQFVADRMRAGDETTAKFAKSWLAKGNFVANVEILTGVDVENKGKVVQVEFSQNQFDSILSVMETLIDLDPTWTFKDGIAIVVERVGTGQTDTKYTFSSVPTALPPPTQAILDSRMDLQVYVDSKFGMQVTKALTVLSGLLGKDVTQTAIGAAMQANVTQIEGPASSGPILDDEIPNFDKPAAEPAQEATFSDLDALLGETPVETPVAPVTATAVVTPVATAPTVVADDAFADIMADLDNL